LAIRGRRHSILRHIHFRWPIALSRKEATRALLPTEQEQKDPQMTSFASRLTARPDRFSSLVAPRRRATTTRNGREYVRNGFQTERAVVVEHTYALYRLFV